MKLALRRLDAELRKGLAPIYLLSGDEPLQLIEAADAIRQAARQAGFTGREIFHPGPGFTWGHVLESADTFSLFGEKRVLDLRFPDKPDQDAAETLLRLAESPSPDCLAVISMGKLSAEEQARSWFRTVEKRGVVVQVWPLTGAKLLEWLDRRMNAKGMLADQSGLRLLAARVEGNLLAAAQEIEKLYGLHGPGRIEDSMIASAVADSARYDVFDLVDATLGQHFARAYRVLEGLRAEGVAPAVVLWALAREIRNLSMISIRIIQGEHPDKVLYQQRIWESRRELVSRALRQLTLDRLHQGLLDCARADRIIKGQQPGESWDALLAVCVGLIERPHTAEPGCPGMR